MLVGCPTQSHGRAHHLDPSDSVPGGSGLPAPQHTKHGLAVAEAAGSGSGGGDEQSKLERNLTELLSRVEGSEEGTVFWAELCRGAHLQSCCRSCAATLGLGDRGVATGLERTLGISLTDDEKHLLAEVRAVHTNARGGALVQLQGIERRCLTQTAMGQSTSRSS